MGDFLLGIQREQMAFGSVFFVSRAVARGSETLRRVPQQIWCQKNATFSSCPFWYIYTQSLTSGTDPGVTGSRRHWQNPTRPGIRVPLRREVSSGVVGAGGGTCHACLGLCCPG